MPVRRKPEIGLFFEEEHSKMSLDIQTYGGRWNMMYATMAEAKTNLSRLAAQANEAGESVIVYKNRKPWIEIFPLAHLRTPFASDSAPAPDDALDGTSDDDARLEDDDNSLYYHPVSDPLPPETEEALREAEDIKAHPEKYKRYSDLEELFADLGLR